MYFNNLYQINILAQSIFFMVFMSINESGSIYLFLELSLVPIMYVMYISSTNESLSANIYLVSYSVVLSIFFLLDLLLSGSQDFNYCFLGSISISVITFFAKLPIYGLHHWLPNAHVECIALSSSILASILLKLSSFSILGHNIFFILSSVLCLKCLFDMWLTSDFKIWVAYSSISHITLVFCGFVLFYKTAFIYYFVPHTLLSSMMFLYFSKDYYFLSSRNYYYFSSSFYLYLLICWCSVPFFITFVPELMIVISFFKFSIFSFLIYFVNFVIFFLVLCNICWSSLLSSFYSINIHNNSILIFCFSFLQFWIFI